MFCVTEAIEAVNLDHTAGCDKRIAEAYRKHLGKPACMVCEGGCKLKDGRPATGMSTTHAYIPSKPGACWLVASCQSVNMRADAYTIKKGAVMLRLPGMKYKLRVWVSDFEAVQEVRKLREAMAKLKI